MAELKNSQSTLKYYEDQLQFAKLQYDETLKYLAVAMESAKEQLTAAQGEYEQTKMLFEKGTASNSEVTRASIRPRELQVEMQRAESLLKLYQAAGDIPELAEIQSSSAGRLSIAFKDSKLGLPKWNNGNCGLTTFSGGFHLTADANPGTFARVLFEKIPGHGNKPLLMKFDVPKSADEVVKKQVVKKQGREGSWHWAFETTFTEEDIQSAVDGKLTRKLLILNPDLSVSERWAKDDASDNTDEAIIATLELLPASADETTARP